MRPDSETALLAYDGSEDAAAAIMHAGRLLAPRPAVVVCVWESLAGALLHSAATELTGAMREAAAEIDEEDRRDAERLASEGAELADQAGFDAQARALKGQPKAWPALLTAADAADAAVVVIGSRGQGAVKSALFGSVSSGLLHHAKRPILVVPRSEEVMPAGPVLVGFDGSDASRAAVDAAAKLLSVPEAVIETVWIPYSRVAAGGVAGAPVAVVSRAVEELENSIRASAEETAHDGVSVAAAAGLEARAEAIQASGPVWSTLRDSAEGHGCSAIAVGSRGRGSVAAAVLGSTSAALVHHSHLPMLVVPSRAD